MAEYSNLSATINAQIRANGVQAITGPVLNAVLTAMVNVLGDGYRLAGVAHPADNPGSPDNRVAYLAAQDGTYTNFGGLTISGEVALLLWDSAWTKATLFSIDTAVTPGSGNLVTSGAVDSALTTLANNIAAAYMQLVPGATEGNLAEFDNAGQVRDAGLATSDLATKDGAFPNLFAGFAGNLVDTRSAGTRQGPFAFRQSGGDGVNYMRKILGKTEAWNQLIFDVYATSEVYGITRTKINDYTLRYYGTSTETTIFTGTADISAIAGHKYLALVYGMPASCSVHFGVGGSAGVPYQIYDAPTDVNISIGLIIPSGTIIDANISFICIDLTLEGLGLTTADQFRALHPLPYYNYNAGVLKNNAATGLETTGFNQWDEEQMGAWPGIARVGDGWSGLLTAFFQRHCFDNLINYTGKIFIRINYSLNEGTGFLSAIYTDGTFADFRLDSAERNTLSFETTEGKTVKHIEFSYGTNGTFTVHSLCINLSDASRNGTYEPYWERTLALGLNSIPCHDENNNAVVVNGLDGVGTAQDEGYGSNAYLTHINKKMAVVDLGDLEWTYDSTWRVFSAPVAGGKLGLYDNAICSAYARSIASWNVINNNTFTFGEQVQVAGTPSVTIHDERFSDAAAFKTAMAGVKLRFELATPKVLTLDNPIPALIEVDNLGTEKRLPEDTADNPQGPFECDSNYSVSTANLVRLLNL